MIGFTEKKEDENEDYNKESTEITEDVEEALTKIKLGKVQRIDVVPPEYGVCYLDL